MQVTNTLAEQTGGRFVLGIGVSHAPMVAGLRKLDYSNPLSQMRPTSTGWTPRRTRRATGGPPQRVLAALGPKMLELSAERADGAHPYFTTPEHTAHARQIIGPDKLLCVEQKVVLTSDAEAGRRPPRRRRSATTPACRTIATTGCASASPRSRSTRATRRSSTPSSPGARPSRSATGCSRTTTPGQRTCASSRLSPDPEQPLGARLERARGVRPRPHDGRRCRPAATMADRLALDARRRRVHQPLPDRGAPRVRRTAHRPGAARRPAHRRGRAARTRCTPRSSRPASAASTSATRSSAPVTGRASAPAGWSPASRGGVVLVLTADFHRDEDGHDYEEPAVLGVPGTGRTAGRALRQPVVRVARRARRGPACRRAGAGPAGVVPSDRAGARRPAAAPARPRLPVATTGRPVPPGSRTPTSPTTPPASRSRSTTPSGSTARSTSTAGCSASCTPSPPAAAAAWRSARSAPRAGDPRRHRRPRGPAPHPNVRVLRESGALRLL